MIAADDADKDGGGGGGGGGVGTKRKASDVTADDCVDGVVEPVTVEAPPPVIPDVVFVVPYRDRVQQRAFFQRHMMNTVLADMPEGMHQIWFVHQRDERRFNRGAIKNIGIRIAQDIYPDHWRNITFVFNDIDTAPFTPGFFDYATIHGVAKHFFGFTFALGGIVSITGHDFDRVNGFPNLWFWG